LKGTVGYWRGYENLLFLEDGSLGIFVRVPMTPKLVPGDQVEVRGTTQKSFRPLVISSSVTLLRHGVPPAPVPATFDDLIRARFDSRLVKVRAVVRSADSVASALAPVRSARLQVLAEGGRIEVNLDSDDEETLHGLLDAEVEITGASAGKFDDKMQQTGVVLYVSSAANIRVLKRASASPWSLPVTPMDQILAVYHVSDRTPRVRVQGTITYYKQGSVVVLQDGSKSLWIETHTRAPLRVGDRADATGFPGAHERLLTLTDGEIRDSRIFQPVIPQLATWRQLGYWSSNAPEGHLYDLVSIEGQVVTEVREASQDEYVLAADGRLFTAVYHHPPATGLLPSMKQIPPGSRIRVSGICMILDSSSVNPGEEVPFNILLRGFDDIVVVAEPSWLNIRNLTRMVSVLLLMVIAVAAWGWTLRRKVRGQTAALSIRIEAEAALERRNTDLERGRRRILENISGATPLAEILEQITELVSFSFDGAPCWCEVTGGARLGTYPSTPERLRIVRDEIPARTGAPLGAIFVGLDPDQPQADDELGALSLGVRTAALAIETRRLYDDLTHRSEFDLLTDIHNRFSLERYLETLMERARQSAGIFGLIYIDLDEFKQVNDLYGHQAGDLFLQEVALRMKAQLRTGDMLARLGGDEFAVLVAQVRNRADVEEIALRLEHSFDEPLFFEGNTLQGSASVGIALYPEDATTKDSLLSAADAAMYRDKNAGRQTHEGMPGSELNPEKQI
jgi:diguanylate cyclase (GGDEF)-like protein